MRFEVTYSKMDEAIRNLGHVKTDMEKCKKRLQGIADSSLFDSGSLKDLNTSMSLLQVDVAVEVKECNTLIESLSNIRGIYGGMDKAGNGNGAVEGKNNRKKVANKNNATMSRVKGNGTLTRTSGGSDDSSSDSNTKYVFGEDLIEVDSMEYLPLPDFIYKMVYTGYTDGDGTWHDPFAPMHGSAVAPEDFSYFSMDIMSWFGVGALANAAGFTNGELLMNYFFGNGEDYVYDAEQLLINTNIRENYINNVSNVAVACEGSIADGETIIIATSPTAGMTGCDGFNDTTDLGKIFNANAWTSVNLAEASMVCEVTRDGDTYTMEYNYYIVDYYNFDGNPQAVDDLNTYGVANNFIGYGKISGTATWTAGELPSIDTDYTLF